MTTISIPAAQHVSRSRETAEPSELNGSPESPAPVTRTDALTGEELDRLLAQERVLRRFDADMTYRAAYAAGFAAGHREAEEDMARWWSALRKTVHDTAARLRGTVAAPVVRPQPADSIWFTPEEWADITGTEPA